MNKVILMGRLARDPEVRYTTGQDTLAIARFTLAVDRRMKREDQINADFISCVSFSEDRQNLPKNTFTRDSKLPLPDTSRQEATKTAKDKRFIQRKWSLKNRNLPRANPLRKTPEILFRKIKAGHRLLQDDQTTGMGINRNLLTHLQQMHLWMFRIRLMKNFHLTDYATKF